jgi:hypothetical protein
LPASSNALLISFTVQLARHDDQLKPKCENAAIILQVRFG